MVLLQQPRWIKIPITSVNGQGSPFTWLAEDVDWIPYWCPQFPRDRPTWLLWGFRLHHRDTAGVRVEGKVKTGHIGKPHRKKGILHHEYLRRGCNGFLQINLNLTVSLCGAWKREHTSICHYWGSQVKERTCASVPVEELKLETEANFR